MTRVLRVSFKATRMYVGGMIVFLPLHTHVGKMVKGFFLSHALPFRFEGRAMC